MDLHSFLESIRNGGVSQISLGSAVLLIFLICVILVFARGLLRILIGSATIAASVCAGLWAWKESAAIGIRYTGKPVPGLDIVWPVLAALVTFVLLRLITGFILKPFSKEGAPKLSFFSRVIRLPFALVPAALLCGAGILLVMHFGNLGELRSFADRSDATKRPEWAKVTEDLKKTVKANVPSDWLAKLDIFDENLRVDLVKLIAAKADKDSPPRAIPVDEATLRPLLPLVKEKRYGTLLHHPEIDKALRDPEIQRALREAALK